jgi:hypothetical protein
LRLCVKRYFFDSFSFTQRRKEVLEAKRILPPQRDRD